MNTTANRTAGSMGWGIALTLCVLSLLITGPALAGEGERISAPVPETRVALVDVSDGSHYPHKGMADTAAQALLGSMADVGSIGIVCPELVAEAIEALEIAAPFDDEQLQALGEELHADVVIAARIASIRFIDYSDQGICLLRTRILDVRARTDVFNIQTRGKGEQDAEALGERQLVEKAITEAAYEAVGQLAKKLVVKGTVSMAFDIGRIRLDLGSPEGMREGAKLAVWDNGDWIADLEVIEVATLSSRAKVTKGDFDALYAGSTFYVTQWPDSPCPCSYEEGEIDKAEVELPQ